MQYIKEDINTVERHRTELYRAKERYSVKLRMLLDDPVPTKMWPSPIDKHSNVLISSSRSSHGGICSGNIQGKRSDLMTQGNYQRQPKKDAFSGSEPHHSPSQSGLAVARKRRVHAQVSVSNYACYFDYSVTKHFHLQKFKKKAMLNVECTDLL